MGVMYYKDANGNVYPINKGPKGDRGPGGGEKDVADHEAKPNPHDQYLTKQDAGTLYADKAHTHPYLPLTGGNVSGNVGLEWHSLTTIWDVQTSNLTGNPDASGGDITVNNALNANGNTIYGVPAPVSGDQVVNKDYVDTKWKMWTGSQAEYDAIPTKDPNTLYVIV